MKKSGLEKALPYLLILFLGFCIADLLLMNFRDLMLPNQAPPTRPQKNLNPQNPPKSNYSIITSRNIFSADGMIPDAFVLAGQEEKNKAPKDQAPVLSSLPLNLVGTIVHSNPEKSLANIEIKGKNIVLPFRPKQEIDKLASLIKVERNKVIFRNLNNQRLEFLEMKSLSKISFGSSKPAATSAPAQVQQVGQNRFEVKRSDVLNVTKNMNEVLQQAAMAPVRNSNGDIEGFKFLSIQPGSIYTQLGFQNGDVIKGVNGEPVDSPAKAMELYNALKNSNSIKMKIGRDGRDQDFEYNVK